MNSIDPLCNDSKRLYDECFNEWFEEFLKGNGKEPPPQCENLFKEYTSCTKEAVRRIESD